MKYRSQYQGECHKIDDDKYYTPEWIARQCMSRFMEMYGPEVTELYEPSAGAGAFLGPIRETGLPWGCTDIAPESPEIPRGDFLGTPLGYRKGRAFVGNPPFGSKLALAQKFYRKCVGEGDFIAWILPISQLGNSAGLYEFDLADSTDLGEVAFSGDRKVRCCFNIYRRPADGLLNPRPSFSLEDVSFMRNDSKGYADFPYDFRILCWGRSAGRLLAEGEEDLCMVYRIRVNRPELRDAVGKALEEADWRAARPSASCNKIQKATIVQELRKRVPGIR